MCGARVQSLAEMEPFTTLGTQPNINATMRHIQMDWMISVCNSLQYNMDTAIVATKV